MSIEEKEERKKFVNKAQCQREARLTVGCEDDFDERFVGDFRRRAYHLQNVVGIVVVTEEQESVGEMIYAVVGDLKGATKKGKKIQ
jgi:hypothetical protein